MALPRLRSGLSIYSSRLSGDVQRTFVISRQVSAFEVVDAIDILEYRPFCITSCSPSIAPDQFGLVGVDDDDEDQETAPGACSPDARTTALTLLSSSSGDLGSSRDAQLAVSFVDDIAVQAMNDLSFAFAVFRASLDIGQCRCVGLHPDGGNRIKHGIGLSVAAAAQSKAMCFAAGCRNRANAAERCRGDSTVDTSIQ